MYEYEKGRIYSEAVNHEEGTSMDIVGNGIYMNIYKRDLSAYEKEQMDVNDAVSHFVGKRGAIFFIARFGDLAWEEGHLNYFLCTNAEFSPSPGHPYYFVITVFDTKNGEVVCRQYIKYTDATSALFQEYMEAQKYFPFDYKKYIRWVAEQYHTQTAEDVYKLVCEIKKEKAL